MKKALTVLVLLSVVVAGWIFMNVNAATIFSAVFLSVAFVKLVDNRPNPLFPTWFVVVVVVSWITHAVVAWLICERLLACMISLIAGYISVTFFNEERARRRGSQTTR